jgi:glycerate kinase
MAMPHLVVASDKFRGTASAAEIGAAVAEVASGAGWTVDVVPMSDGGEGMLEAVGGQRRFAAVTGPLGESVNAEWRLLSTGHDGLTAVIEMSEAAGRSLLPHPTGDDPVRASTSGVGQLLLAAAQAGVASIVIGCGGSATTDGGWGAVEAVEAAGSAGSAPHSPLAGLELVVACDVTTPYRKAAAVFGPQKGATPDQVIELTARLDLLAERYRDHYGVDVDAIVGAGAAGGLAGGLAVLGARLAPGFELVANLVALGERLSGADLVVTGEGHLDRPSFHGKVPGGVHQLVNGRCPVLCVVGAADDGLDIPTGMEVVSLTERFGSEPARHQTAALVAQVVRTALHR